MIVFVQPFGLNSPGGGARILRALLKEAPIDFLSICTSLQAPPPTTVGQELYLPIRPYFGWIESTRFSDVANIFDFPLAGIFRYRLTGICRHRKATAIHAIAHDLTFWYAYQIAQTLELPYYLSVHDDLRYALQGSLLFKQGMSKIAEVWKGAEGRFVISDELGKEYSRRYGKKAYTIVTDGLDKVPSKPQIRPTISCRIYFMGLFHISYKVNFKAFLQALQILQKLRPDWNIALTCRCGFISPKLLATRFPVTWLPFASEQEVIRDMEQADMVYLPLPFGQEYDDFVRYSLSTKMITYLASGLPILYHGPVKAAASQLLAQHQAAILINSLDPHYIAEALINNRGKTAEIVQNALDLGVQQFMLIEQRNKFWNLINKS
jgi:glycosyltransferase involved in cell wall biosynthesis